METYKIEIFVICCILLYAIYALFIYDNNDPICNHNVRFCKNNGHLMSFAKPTYHPPRINMSQCKPIFGKITFIVIVTSDKKNNYRVAQNSLQCYLKSTNYTFKFIEIDNDEHVKKHCSHHNLFFFKRICAAAAYLNETDWMVFLGADIGVVNPNHCIEEYIDDRVNIMFYTRFISIEIMADSFIIKNTQYSHNFLKKWANWEFIEKALPVITNKTTFDYFYRSHGVDNGVLQLVVLESVLPNAKVEYANCYEQFNTAYDLNKASSYYGFVLCVRTVLGSEYFWPGKIKIYRKGLGWARDGGHLTYDDWSEHDFMIHDWKGDDITKLAYWHKPASLLKEWKSPFLSMLNISECGKGYSGWNWRIEKKKSVEEIKKQLVESEKLFQDLFLKPHRFNPLIDSARIDKCYPKCDK